MDNSKSSNNVACRDSRFAGKVAVVTGVRLDVDGGRSIG